MSETTSTSAKLEEQIGKVKVAEESVHQLLQCCTMFGHLMEEMNFVKATLDMSLSYFYKDRGAAIGHQVQEFIKLQPAPSTTDFAISNFLKYVTEASYQYSRVFNHFKASYENTKPDTQEGQSLLDDMETFYEQRHHPFDTIVLSYMDLASNEQCQNTDLLKQLNTEARETTSNDPVASYDKSDPVGPKLSENPNFAEVIQSPLCREYFHQFLDSQISGENFLFWDEVRKFKEKQEGGMDKADLKKAAEKIVARFLSIGGENEINISQSAREPIMDSMESPSPEIFDGAVKEVYSMMHGTFAAYEQSPEYKLMQRRRRRSYQSIVTPQKSDVEVFSSDIKNFQKTIRTVHQMISKIAPPRKNTKSDSGSAVIGAAKPTGAITVPAPSLSAPSMVPKGITYASIGAQISCMTLVDNYLWIGMTDGICVFNPLTMAQVKQLKHPGKVHSIIQVSPSEVWSASDGGGPIKCWDSERFKSAKDVNSTSFVKGEVVTHMAKISNDTIWIGTMSGMIKIWTVAKKKMVHEMKVGMFPIWCMIAQESSSSVWVAHGDDITRYHSVSYRKAETFPKEHTAHVTSMVLTEQFTNKNNFSSITTVLWTGSLDGWIYLWDTEKQTCIQKFHEHTDAVLHLSQSKLFVFSSSFDRTIISWDKHNPAKVKHFTDGHTGPVTCSLALGRVSGGSALWTGSQDFTIRAWSLE